MKIRLARVYVDDQEKALSFYTEVLGLTKKGDFTQGSYRWLTVTSTEEPDGAELQLALLDGAEAKAWQEAMLMRGQPAVVFFTNDVDADHARASARGAQFTMPPTDATGSRIATLHDGCGNIVQLTQLVH